MNFNGIDPNSISTIGETTIEDAEIEELAVEDLTIEDAGQTPLYTLPTTAPTTGQIIEANGTSQLVWTTPASSGDLKSDGTVSLSNNWLNTGGYEIRSGILGIDGGASERTRFRRTAGGANYDIFYPNAQATQTSRLEISSGGNVSFEPKNEYVITSSKPAEFGKFDYIRIGGQYFTEEASKNGTGRSLFNSADGNVFGAYNQFDTISFDLAQPAIGGTFVLDYYRRSTLPSVIQSWQPLAIVSDFTSNLTVGGSIRFTLPSDWGVDEGEVANYGVGLYLVRLRYTIIPSQSAIVKVSYAGDKHKFTIKDRSLRTTTVRADAIKSDCIKGSLFTGEKYIVSFVDVEHATLYPTLTDVLDDIIDNGTQVMDNIGDGFVIGMPHKFLSILFDVKTVASPALGAMTIEYSSASGWKLLFGGTFTNANFGSLGSARFTPPLLSDWVAHDGFYKFRFITTTDPSTAPIIIAQVDLEKYIGMFENGYTDVKSVKADKLHLTTRLRADNVGVEKNSFIVGTDTFLFGADYLSVYSTGSSNFTQFQRSAGGLSYAVILPANAPAGSGYRLAVDNGGNSSWVAPPNIFAPAYASIYYRYASGQIQLYAPSSGEKTLGLGTYDTNSDTFPPVVLTTLNGGINVGFGLAGAYHVSYSVEVDIIIGGTGNLTVAVYNNSTTKYDETRHVHEFTTSQQTRTLSWSGVLESEENKNFSLVIDTSTFSTQSIRVYGWHLSAHRIA